MEQKNDNNHQVAAGQRPYTLGFFREETRDRHHSLSSLSSWIVVVEWL